MLRNAQNVCSNNIAFLFSATKSLRFYRNEVHLRCGLCQCRTTTLCLCIWQFFFFFRSFDLFIFFYFVHIHRRKCKKKISSELYNIVIIHFFSFIKSLKVSLRSGWLTKRDVKERDLSVYEEGKSVSSTAPNSDSHLSDG